MATFPMTLSDLNPGFKVTGYLQVEYLKKLCVLGTKSLKNTNRKPYIYRMVRLSKTLSDRWPQFQGHNFFWHWISQTTRDRAIVTIERQLEVICALSHGDISNDIDAPLTRFSRSRHFWSRISQKRCILGNKLLKIINRKPYTIYGMISLSMTLSDLWPQF